MVNRVLQLPLFLQHIEYVPLPLYPECTENVRVPVTSSLVLYSEWIKQPEVYRKIEQAFHYLKVKDGIEAQANRILNGHGKSRLLPTLSTGVGGDYRTYKFVLMIETSSKSDYEILGKLSTQLTNEIEGINRVVLLTAGKDISDKDFFIDDLFLKE